jgi:hypothetical protein
MAWAATGTAVRAPAEPSTPTTVRGARGGRPFPGRVPRWVGPRCRHAGLLGIVRGLRDRSGAPDSVRRRAAGRRPTTLAVGTFVPRGEPTRDPAGPQRRTDVPAQDRHGTFGSPEGTARTGGDTDAARRVHATEAPRDAAVRPPAAPTACRRRGGVPEGLPPCPGARRRPRPAGALAADLPHPQMLSRIRRAVPADSSPASPVNPGRRAAAWPGERGQGAAGNVRRRDRGPGPMRLETLGVGPRPS